jgi:hypothetical protein
MPGWRKEERAMSQYSQIDPSRGRTRFAGAASYGRPVVASTTESEGPTYDELYEEARKRNLKGRSKMSKTELERALGR